jgi:hypothetical protein
VNWISSEESTWIKRKPIAIEVQHDKISSMQIIVRLCETYYLMVREYYTAAIYECNFVSDLVLASFWRFKQKVVVDAMSHSLNCEAFVIWCLKHVAISL